MAAAGLLRSRESIEQVRRWTRARSVSEAVKTEVFLFLSQAGAYSAPDRSFAIQELNALLQSILAARAPR
jgi:hypothetical protein